MHIAILGSACVLAVVVFISITTLYAGSASPKVIKQIFGSLLSGTSERAAADEGDALTDTAIQVNETEIAPEELRDETVALENTDTALSSDSTVMPTDNQADAPAQAIIDTPVTNNLPGIVDIPAKTTEPEAIVEETVPNPYTEVRSILEGVITKFDWLYTLRAGADYDAISNLRVTSQTSFTHVIDIMESGADNMTIQGSLCEADGNVSNLRTSLAINSDDTQTELDADNEDILTEIESALGNVVSIWQQNSGLSLICSN